MPAAVEKFRVLIFEIKETARIIPLDRHQFPTAVFHYGGTGRCYAVAFLIPDSVCTARAAGQEYAINREKGSLDAPRATTRRAFSPVCFSAAPR